MTNTDERQRVWSNEYFSYSRFFLYPFIHDQHLSLPRHYFMWIYWRTEGWTNAREKRKKCDIFTHAEGRKWKGTKESSKLKQRKNPGILYVFIQLFFFFHFVFAASLNFTLLLLRGTEGEKERERAKMEIYVLRETKKINNNWKSLSWRWMAIAEADTLKSSISPSAVTIKCTFESNSSIAKGFVRRLHSAQFFIWIYLFYVFSLLLLLVLSVSVQCEN